MAPERRRQPPEVRVSVSKGGSVMASMSARFETFRDDVLRWSSRKMDKGRRKYGDSWVDASPEYLLRRMEEEFYEFRQAVEHDKDKQKAMEELADIVNFGIMYAVVKFVEYEESEEVEGKWV